MHIGSIRERLLEEVMSELNVEGFVGVSCRWWWRVKLFRLREMCKCLCKCGRKIIRHGILSGWIILDFVIW